MKIHTRAVSLLGGFKWCEGAFIAHVWNFVLWPNVSLSVGLRVSPVLSTGRQLVFARLCLCCRLLSEHCMISLHVETLWCIHLHINEVKRCWLLFATDSDQSALQQPCVMRRLLKQNELINALNKGFISITGPVFDTMEIKDMGNRRERLQYVFLFKSLFWLCLH